MKHLNYILLLALFTACTPRQSGQVEVSDNLVAVYSVSEIDSIVDLEIDDVLTSELDYVSSRPPGAIYPGQLISEFIASAKQQQYTVERRVIRTAWSECMFDDDVFYKVYKNGELMFSIEPGIRDYDTNKVRYIWLWSPKFKTEEGIGTGSTIAELESKYQIKHISIEGIRAFVIYVKEVPVGFGICEEEIGRITGVRYSGLGRVLDRDLPDNLPIAVTLLSNPRSYITPDFRIITTHIHFCPIRGRYIESTRSPNVRERNINNGK